MSDLVVVAFPTEEKAEEVGRKLLDLQQEYLIEVEEAVVATKGLIGPVKFNNLHSPATTTTNCASWGALIGMIILKPWAGRYGAGAGPLGDATHGYRDR